MVDQLETGGDSGRAYLQAGHMFQGRSDDLIPNIVVVQLKLSVTPLQQLTDWSHEKD